MAAARHGRMHPPSPCEEEEAGPSTIYDMYPLTLRTRLLDGPRPLERALQPDLDQYHDLDASLEAANQHGERESIMFERKSIELRASNMGTRLGTFHGEIYETKEHSRMFSVLKRRSRATGANRTVDTGHETHAKFTAEDVVRCGTLTKQGSWRRNWKTRFFILRKDYPSLCYYKSEDKLELLGAIVVTGDTLVLNKCAAGGHAPYRFQVRTESAALLLEAESKDNQQRWIDACQQLVDNLRAEKFRQNAAKTRGDRPVPTAKTPDRHSMPGAVRQSVSTAQLAMARPSDATLAGGQGETSPRTRQTRRRGRDGTSNPLPHQSSTRSLNMGESEISHLMELSGSSSDEDEDDEEDDRSDCEDNQKEEEEDNEQDVWGSQVPENANSPAVNVIHKCRSRSVQQYHAYPLVPGRYDIVIQVVVGKTSKLVRSESSNDKMACFVKVTGYSYKTKDIMDLGSTDAVKLSSVIAAGSSEGASTTLGLPFTIVITADVNKIDQLGFTLYKTWGNSQTVIGLGRCVLDSAFRTSQPKLISLTEKSSSFQHIPTKGNAPSEMTLANGPRVDAAGGSSTNLLADSNTVQLVVQAFQALPLQAILPTTCVDMASTKYLLPTTLSIDDASSQQQEPAIEDFMRASDGRTLIDNGSFVTVTSDVGTPGTRFIAVDEILRVPRSTFALPLAYLDHLEEIALERARQLQKQADLAAEGGQENALNTFELDYYRKKMQEYIKQRQFLMKQEKRLLQEQADHKIYHHTREQVQQQSGKKNGKTKASADDDRNGDLLAPFKRSTYKSLDLWQFLPTNMQNQYICVHQPPTVDNQAQEDMHVWHTMTMGCPAAHSKGFANGGYANILHATDAVRNSNPASASSDEESAFASSSDTERGSILGGGQYRTRRSRVSGSKVAGMNPAEEPLSALKQRLEMQERLDIVGSQILSAAVACILASLDLAALGSPRHRAQLSNAIKFGYVVNFESLLSTQGKEIGMLEDFAAGAKWLRKVFVQFRKHPTSAEHFVVKRYTPPERRAVAGGTGLDGAYTPSTLLDQASETGSSSSASSSLLIVTIGVSEAQLAVLPPLLASGKPFRLRCVLFTQGVNEKQSLVHALKQGAVKVQDRINRDNLEELKDLYAHFKRVHSPADPGCVDLMSQHLQAEVGHDDNGEAQAVRAMFEVLDDLLAQIEQHICSPGTLFKKNVGLLMDTSDFCRELGGARVTCCKSGKDRTAMSVTLEQARICCSELRVTQGKRLCASMRLYGVRRKNVYMNTKAAKFAFNEMQRKMLPDCYKPPPGTYKSGKT
ncbi:hypothetical protein Poli38472_011355 [Pythium oligandrum]|uniref:PH domain-containing protein n=1 Tax=Pythium oligandrum TaxID=41045 RepID=A0A8K1CKS2_PYTOL|nr:hypothetical protein Poli38472_011355 [Pythium oligandrum]|eukprot:TMW64475.1 hypothetical protein Poli38472_011355 [Pythium oligandrum]